MISGDIIWNIFFLEVTIKKNHPKTEEVVFLLSTVLYYRLKPTEWLHPGQRFDALIRAGEIFP